MEKYLYLTIDFISILVPLLFSFQSKISFSKKWKCLWPAILFPALLFITWDELFTGMGIWGFNPKYVTGIYLIHLPLEEVLFFFCIPYSCLFTYEAVNHFFPNEIIPNNGSRITTILIPGLFLVGVVYYDKWYTSVTCISTAAFLLLLVLKIKPDYLGKFYLSFFFILIPFFFINSILTGTGLEEPVVWSNHSEIMGVRMFTIPFEDTFYGMLLILMNVSIFEYLQKRSLTT